jgi:hypothetical protein
MKESVEEMKSKSNKVKLEEEEIQVFEQSPENARRSEIRKPK